MLSADPAKITGPARRAYAAACATDSALTAGFGWFRAFGRDAAANQRAGEGPPVSTPLLYLRGERERGGDIGAYAEGLRGAGIKHVEQAIVPGAGQFTAEEAPEETWRLIAGLTAGPLPQAAGAPEDDRRIARCSGLSRPAVNSKCT